MSAGKLYSMDRALTRLDRMQATIAYFIYWRRFMKDEEIDQICARLLEDVHDARQVAMYWHDFARRNGIELPDEPQDD